MAVGSVGGGVGTTWNVGKVTHRICAPSILRIVGGSSTDLWFLMFERVVLIVAHIGDGGLGLPWALRNKSHTPSQSSSPPRSIEKPVAHFNDPGCSPFARQAASKLNSSPETPSLTVPGQMPPLTQP